MTSSLSEGDMSESKAQQVEIREVDGLTLRKLVDYIYTAEIEVTEDNVQVCMFFLEGDVSVIAATTVWTFVHIFSSSFRGFQVSVLGFIMCLAR